jgi:hypothetical protein
MEWAPGQFQYPTFTGITSGGIGQQPGPGGWWGDTQAYGTKPQVPYPTTTAGQAIGGNIGNLGALYGLAGPINQFQAQQAGRQLEINDPGYLASQMQTMQNAAQLKAGQLPQDVINQQYLRGAERGIFTGTEGSPADNAAIMKGLDLTSLQAMQMGEGFANAAYQRTPQPGLFNPMSMMVTPEQTQAAEMARSLYASAPDPSAAARTSLGTALAGLGAGRGSVGAPGGGGVSTTNPYMTGYGGPQDLGMYYGGQLYGPGQAPTGGFPWSNPATAPYQDPWGQASPGAYGQEYNPTASEDTWGQTPTGAYGQEYNPNYQAPWNPYGEEFNPGG